MYRNYFIISPFLLAALMMSACAHRDTTGVSPSQAVSHYTVLEFQVGHSSLRDTEKEKIKNLARAVEKTGKTVSEVRILAWDDEMQSREPKLVTQRASQVRAFIKEDLKSKAPLEIYDMSQDPQRFTELVLSHDPKRKTTFENTETTSFGHGPKSSLAGNKSSKAIVMVHYE